MWTCEFVFGLVSKYLDGCDKQKKKKEKKNMMTCRVAAQLKTVSVDIQIDSKFWLYFVSENIQFGWTRLSVSDKQNKDICQPTLN